MRSALAVGVAGAALLLAGCASGPTIKSTIGKGSTFCNDMSTFAGQVLSLQDAANEPKAALESTLPDVHAALVKLQQEAPAADTVNGKPLKADLGTIASVAADLLTAVHSASATDPNAVGKALSAIRAKDDQALVDAVTRVDGYASKVCGITAAPAPTTSTTGAPTGPALTTSTTGAPAGPAGPASATTTTGGSGSTTTTAGSTPTT